MKPEEFINCICEEVIEDTNSAYHEIINNTAMAEVEDDYWKQVLTLHANLDDTGKKTIMMIMKQVSIDTVSGVLAILDGVTMLDKFDEDFSLTYNKGSSLNGELQDIFLEKYEA